MLKSMLLWLTILATLVLIAFAVYAYHPEIEPIAAHERSTFDAQTVEKGRVLAAAGYCITCHTAQDGAPYAGNFPMDTGFGTLYSTNITPDPESGIGTWSEDAFLRAMIRGVDREGRHLFPAFPYDHYTRMSADDISAIYAFLMSEVAPVQSEQKDNEMPFPLNQRFLQAGWKLLFVDFGRYEPDSSQSAEWNRGAYLVEGVTHCGACHTPRNALGAEKKNEQFDGAVINHWVAPALTAANASAIRWSAADYSEYLGSGATAYHGIAAGPMGPVVHAGVRELPAADLNAIGIYLAEGFGTATNEGSASDIVTASLDRGRPSELYRADRGEELYAIACASCHYNATQIALGRPDLGVNSATRLDEPNNLIHVILDGVGNEDGIVGVVMPGFRDAFNDEEVASIASYLRLSRTDKEAWAGLADKVAEIRAVATQ